MAEEMQEPDEDSGDEDSGESYPFGPPEPAAPPDNKESGRAEMAVVEDKGEGQEKEEEVEFADGEGEGDEDEDKEEEEGKRYTKGPQAILPA